MSVAVAPRGSPSPALLIYNSPMRNTSTTLRWIAVLLAAILAAWVAHFVFGLLNAVVGGVAGESVSDYLRLLWYYAAKDAAFVLAGAAVSPFPRPTAVALAIVAIALSLLTHVMSQQRVGATNYLHFAAESVGALVAVLSICIAQRMLRTMKF